MTLNAYQKADPLIRDLWQNLMEKDDRNSPAEYLKMCLITFEEFEGYLKAFLADKSEGVAVSRLTLEWIIRKTADKRNPQVAFVCQKLLDGEALSALRAMGDEPATPL